MSDAENKWGGANDTLQPNPVAIRQHIEWQVAPALGEYDDALFEIAVDSGQGPNRARLFSLDEIAAAVDYAVFENRQKRNVYIGAALKKPDTPREGRSSADAFYVATAVPADVDANYDTVRKTMWDKIGNSGLTVITGTSPAYRSQHWFRLMEPCAYADEFANAFATLVAGIGADRAVKDAARVMRLGGTVSWPNERKRAKGYKDERTTITINQIEPVAIERILDLQPVEFVRDPQTGVLVRGTDVATEIVKDGYGLVTDGRETWFRNLVFAMVAQFQDQCGADPTPDDIFPEAWRIFNQRCDNRDGHWKPADMMKRVKNTLRRLEAGHLPLRAIGQPRSQEEAPYVWGETFRLKLTEGEKITRESRIDGLTEKPPEPPPEILEWDEWKATYRKPKFLVKKMLQYGYVYTITGRPGTGKTAVAVYLSFCVAQGEKFGQHQCKKGRVLFCAGENPPDVNVRTIALEEALGLNGLNIAFIPKVFTLETHLAFIKDYIEKHGQFDLIIIDTLQAFFPGEDENSNPEMIAYVNKQIRPMAELPGNPCVLVLAHPPKGAATKDEMQPRGAGGFTGAIDGNITLWREDKGERVVEFAPHVEKFRGSPFDPINIELMAYESTILKDEDGDPVTSVIARVLDRDALQAKKDKAGLEQDNVMLAMLNIFKADGKWPSAQKIAKELGSLSDRNVQRIQNILASAKPAKNKYVERKGERQPYTLTPRGVEYVEQVIKDNQDEFNEGYFVIET